MFVYTCFTDALRPGDSREYHYMLAEYLQTCTLDEYRNVQLQVSNALNVGLHTNNVLIQTRDIPEVINIYDRNMNIIKSIAYIIDYGKSTFMYQGVLFGEDTKMYEYTYPVFDINFFLKRNLGDIHFKGAANESLKGYIDTMIFSQFDATSRVLLKKIYAKEVNIEQ